MGMRTPWDESPKKDGPLRSVAERGPALKDVRLRFGVTLSTPEQANRFANQFRVKFSRSCSTVIDATVWVVFRCGAVDGHDASVQAAAAVRTVATHKLVREQPRAVHFYDVEVVGPVLPLYLARVVAEREDALHKAILWGLLSHPLVEGEAAAQRSGRRGLRDRSATGRHVADAALIGRHIPTAQQSAVAQRRAVAAGRRGRPVRRPAAAAHEAAGAEPGSAAGEAAGSGPAG